MGSSRSAQREFFVVAMHELIETYPPCSNFKHCKDGTIVTAQRWDASMYKSWMGCFINAVYATLTLPSLMILCRSFVGLQTFHCRRGKAYLYNSVVNVIVGDYEERMMTTGMHVVADIYCVYCNQNVGWRYETAYEDSQKYKEGKFILERARIDGSCEHQHTQPTIDTDIPH
ncbi:hypothetical protein GOP47_0020088 [Adiantum capillus-veneris]|uniref:Yippee domain-containing protein n=1 Tax=Adiantum capillus-veneris TaxID=13818 RepID=A0A9D4Z7N9_ADICA|nr:hypothetical protein GOP47_0020088 [Adiantum capillus-veneris]